MKFNNNSYGTRHSKVLNLAVNSGALTGSNLVQSINKVENAMIQNHRVLLIFYPKGFNNQGHIVAISKLKIWESGKFKMWTIQTSPERIINVNPITDFSKTNIRSDQSGNLLYNFYSVYPK